MRKFDLNGIRLAEYQGKLFEYSTINFAGSSSIFIRRFLHSNLLKILDQNESALLSTDIHDGLLNIDEQFGKTDYGVKKYSKSTMFWLGYLYRYISYTRQIDTRLLFKIFDYHKIADLYYTYHTQDLEWCIANLLELYDLDENIFDPNWRLKQIMTKKKMTK